MTKRKNKRKSRRKRKYERKYETKRQKDVKKNQHAPSGRKNKEDVLPPYYIYIPLSPDRGIYYIFTSRMDNSYFYIGGVCCFFFTSFCLFRFFCLNDIIKSGTYDATFHSQTVFTKFQNMSISSFFSSFLVRKTRLARFQCSLNF